jgi:lipoic acid synthetase
VVGALRAAVPPATVELLVPDLCGGAQALGLVLAARPDVIGHNLETVPRLYPRVRPQADYRRSRQLLERAAHWARAQDGGGSDGRRPLVKTGIMVGLGEQPSEVEELLADCADAGVDVLTIGQYLRPAAACLPVERYVPPTEFAAWERRGAALGLRVHAAPFVRSSYRAGELFARSAQSYGSA